MSAAAKTLAIDSLEDILLTMTLTDAALDFAHRAHLSQTREGKAPLPYLHHPLEVAWLLAHLGGVSDCEEIASALLHDTVEEANVSLEKIEEEFGSRICSLVRELTRNEPLAEVTSAMSKKDLYDLRTKLLLQGINEMSPTAQRIKLADRLSNWRHAQKVRTRKRLERYRIQTKSILAAIPRSVSPPLWDTLKAECSDA